MKVGIIGGSGLYDMEGIKNLEEVDIYTPFGKPSGRFIKGILENKEVVFLPRHGKGHSILPGEINYRANIWGLKSLGVTHIISSTAVGSLKEEIAPGQIVIPDQFIDRTRGRKSTFFGDGIVAHLQFGNPVCKNLTDLIFQSAKEIGVDCFKDGTYVCINGPIFSTKAESLLYKNWGASVIGMTNATEAKLAREAELCYATISLTTDYDCWFESEEEVNVETILEVMANNISTAKNIIKQCVKNIDMNTQCPDQSALQYAILTKKEMIHKKIYERLSLLIGKYI